MATITEDYVSFETARLLKKKGFDIICDKIYRMNGYLCPFEYSMNIKGNGYYLAPTQQMATRWLRAHKLYINILYNKYLYGEKSFYWYIEYLNEKPVDERIIKTSTDTEEYTYRTYEEATEAAIQYSLKNLI